MSYLCNRNRETKIANDKVPWMSGLVSGLQNRVRRFESARNLQKRKWIRMKIFCYFFLTFSAFFSQPYFGLFCIDFMAQSELQHSHGLLLFFMRLKY